MVAAPLCSVGTTPLWIPWDSFCGTANLPGSLHCPGSWQGAVPRPGQDGSFPLTPPSPESLLGLPSPRVSWQLPGKREQAPACQAWGTLWARASPCAALDGRAGLRGSWQSTASQSSGVIFCPSGPALLGSVGTVTWGWAGHEEPDPQARRQRLLHWPKSPRPWSCTVCGVPGEPAQLGVLQRSPLTQPRTPGIRRPPYLPLPGPCSSSLGLLCCLLS